MLVTVAPTLFRLQQKNNSDSWGYLFHIHDGHEYEHFLDSTQRQQLLHHCLVLLLGRCNYYLHSNVATFPPTYKACDFLSSLTCRWRPLSWMAAPLVTDMRAPWRQPSLFSRTPLARCTMPSTTMTFVTR